MILKGSQRGGARQLAAHLLNDRDNDHIELEHLRGFVSNDLTGALHEAQAVAGVTKCKQFMFSLSINPPKDADASKADLIDAADRAEVALGLTGQPRAMVIHEKNGRRHAHIVWSRIDADQMKAVNLPHFKNRLAGLSKKLYLDHGWELPHGHYENGGKSPMNFTLAEWQQAKRLDLHPQELKQIAREAWAGSDSRKSFASAMEDRGYLVARGDRRGFVVVDVLGGVHSLTRLLDTKVKDIAARMGAPETLPGVEDAKAVIDQRIHASLKAAIIEHRAELRARLGPLQAEREQMVAAQRQERVTLERGLEARRVRENAERQARFRKGVLGVWEILTGKAAELRRQNEREAMEGHRRDEAHREAICAAQLVERRELEERIDAQHQVNRAVLKEMMRRIGTTLFGSGLGRPSERDQEREGANEAPWGSRSRGRRTGRGPAL